MTLLALLLALLAAPVLADPLPPMPPEDHGPWQAVGRVNIAGYARREMCTGTLIAPDRVLTAAHCVMRGGRFAPLGDVHFVAGWLGGDYAGHSTARAIETHPQAGSFDLDVEHDLALILLADPIDVAPLPLGTAPRSGPFAIVGYMDRRPNRLSARFDCNGVTGPRTIELDCATRWGNSGGPILQRGPDGWEVIAVVSAGNATETLGAWAHEFAAR